MASLTSALDAIKHLQTVLDDEKESMTDGAHLRASNAALAAFNKVQELARKKRSRENAGSDVEEATDSAPDSDSESGSNNEDEWLYGDHVDEGSLSVGQLARRWSRLLNCDAVLGEGFFMDILDHLMGNSVVDPAHGVNGLNHTMRLAAAMAIADALELRLREAHLVGYERLLQWMNQFVCDGALLFCVRILDNGERESDTGIVVALDPRPSILDTFASFCSFSASFRQKMKVARAMETIQYMMRHSAHVSLRNAAQKVHIAMGGADVPLAVLRKRQTHELEVAELAKIWADQVAEQVLHFYDLLQFTDELGKTDKEHVAAFVAIERVFVQWRGYRNYNRFGDDWHVLATSTSVLKRNGAEKFVRTLRQGFHWNVPPHKTDDPRPAAMSALLAVFDASSKNSKTEIVRQLVNKNVRRFLRETTRVHDEETHLGKLCREVVLQLDKEAVD
tara:strand:- start:2156 stop:3502 length:1347 start_codon:yes stop_codon:yes gene_type:complete